MSPRQTLLVLILCAGCDGAAGIQGPKGDPGAEGPLGPAGAVGPTGAPGHLGALKERTASTGAPLNEIATVTATCESGRVIAGGCRWGKEAGQMTAWMSTPTSDGDGWICSGIATVDVTDIEALAYCEEDS